MELAWLEDFNALEQTGNFSRAAAMRHISQSAFSRRIQTLESWVGVPLFVRDSRRVQLTAAGSEFKAGAISLIHDIYRIRKNAIETTARENATLRFAATHTLSSTFFPHWISQLESLGAPSDIYLISDTLHICEQAFMEGQAQFLLSYYHAAVSFRFSPQSCPHQVIGNDVLIPFCVPKADGRPQWCLPASHSHPVPILRYSQASGFSQILENTLLTPQKFPANTLKFATHFTSHLASVLFSLACEGKGVAWLPLSMVQPALKEKKLVQAGDARWHIPLEVHLYRYAATLHQTAENFWKICRGRK